MTHVTESKLDFVTILVTIFVSKFLLRNRALPAGLYRRNRRCERHHPPFAFPQEMEENAELLSPLPSGKEAREGRRKRRRRRRRCHKRKLYRQAPPSLEINGGIGFDRSKKLKKEQSVLILKENLSFFGSELMMIVLRFRKIR